MNRYSFAYVSLVVIGIILALYVGVCIMFVGGILEIIDMVNTNTLSITGLIWPGLKMLLSGFTGWLIYFIFIGLGSFIVRRRN